MTMRFAMLLLLLTAAAPGQQARKALIIGIDGCRPDALQAAFTPNIDAIVAAGSVSYQAQTEIITSSGPAWSSCLTGVHLNQHGVTNNSFSGSNFQQFPHLFTRVKEVCSNAATASIVNWSPINTEILSDSDFTLTGLSDVQVAAQAAAHLVNQNPDIMYLHFDAPDGAGHSSGYSVSNPAYTGAIAATDVHVGTVIAGLQSRPTFAQEDWLIVMTTDHGGLGTSHGGTSPDELTTFLIVSGPGTVVGTIPGTPEIVDVVPTVLGYLGISVDPAWSFDGVARGLAGPAPAGSFPCISCPRSLTATPNHVAKTVALNWVPSNDPTVTGYDVRRDGVTVANLGPMAASHVDVLPGGFGSGHVPLRYEVEAQGGQAPGVCDPIAANTVVSAGDVRLTENFNGMTSDAQVAAAGWGLIDAASPIENATWTITNPAGRINPPGVDGAPTSGSFMISDSDVGGSPSSFNTVGSGMSHDLWTPTFNCSGMARVIVHMNVSAVLNNNGDAVFAVDVTTNAGATFTTMFLRTSPSRTSAPAATLQNTDGFYGPLDVDISAAALGQSAVRVRVRHFEPTWDWWIAIDDVIVDDVDRRAGGPDVVLALEEFNAGLPSGWAISGLNSGADTWTTTDPCGRSTLAAGGSLPHQSGRGLNRLGADFMILDSDCNPDPSEDEFLMTPVINCSLHEDVYLHFQSEIIQTSSMTAEVLLSTDGGTTWNETPIFSYRGLTIDEEPAFADRTFRVPGADRETQVRFAFRLQSPGNEWWWAIDSVEVTGSALTGASAVNVGGGCGVSGPPTLVGTPPRIGANFIVLVAGGPPSLAGTLIVTNVPAAPTGFGPCLVQVDPNPASWIQVPIATGSTGSLAETFSVPPFAALEGFQFMLQAVFFPTGGPLTFDLSNGLLLTLGY